MTDNENDNIGRTNLIAAIAGGALLGAFVGLAIGAVLGKRAADGGLPEVDWDDVLVRCRRAAETIRAKIQSPTGAGSSSQ